MVASREPVAVANAVAGFVELLLVALIAFGLDLTAEQVAAVTAVIIGAGQVAATLYARPKVTPEV